MQSLVWLMQVHDSESPRHSNRTTVTPDDEQTISAQLVPDFAQQGPGRQFIITSLSSLQPMHSGYTSSGAAGCAVYTLQLHSRCSFDRAYISCMLTGRAELHG